MSISLEVEKRALRPRSAKNKLREQGLVPAVVYGHKVENTAVTVNAKALDKILRESGKNTVVSLNIDGQKINVLIGEAQFETFTKSWEHVDFIAVDMSEIVEVEAEVTLTNEDKSKGVKAGGVLVQMLYTVKVKATPDNLPERVEVDITDLDKNQSITIGDLGKQTGFTIEADPEEIIATIDEPKTQEQLEADIAGDVAEDQVVDSEEAAAHAESL